jgi:hypothetical protein
VVAEIGHTKEVPLDACVIGVNPDRTAALREAANKWLRLVGAPILSLMTQRYVLDADHFGADATWGVPGRHGFVGPAFARGAVDEIDFRVLATASFFQDAASLIEARTIAAWAAPSRSSAVRLPNAAHRGTHDGVTCPPDGASGRPVAHAVHLR